MLWQLSMEQWIVSFAFLSAFCYICGWVADGIMRSSGFGHVGNWMLMLLGSYAGMYSYNVYGYQLEWYPVLSVLVTFGTATFLLLFMATLKRALDA